VEEIPRVRLTWLKGGLDDVLSYLRMDGQEVLILPPTEQREKRISITEKTEFFRPGGLPGLKISMKNHGRRR